jgi:NADPH:quinone reductase-like Zn-dependent oxidoreductase
MRAAILYESGAHPIYGETSDPVPGIQEQLIFMKAAAIKNIDRMLANDTHYDGYKNFPVVIGTDGVGLLENGLRVYSGSKSGMMAEKVAVNNKWFVAVPDNLDTLTAAAIPNPAVSAWLSLEWKGRLQKGDHVLVLGATGITGRLAIQLAKLLGAGKIVAVGRNPEMLDKLYGLGADLVISLSQGREKIQEILFSEIEKQPFQIVLDYLWGEPAEQVLNILTGHDLEAVGNLTRWIQIGEMAGSSIQLNASTLRSSGIELCGQGGGGLPREILAKIPTFYLPEIFRLAMEGKISVETEAVSLKNIERAWLEKNQKGKRQVVTI